MPAPLSHHFSGTFLAAAIVDAQGKRFPLWNTAGVASKGSSPTMLPYLSEVSINVGLGAVPEIKATLTPPYREAIRILDSPLIEYVTNQLQVQFGYSGGSGKAALSPVYTGMMLKPEVQLGDQVTITLSAQGVAGFGAGRQNSNINEKKASRKSLIEQLITSKKKRKVTVNDSAVKGGSDAKKLLDEKIPYAQSGTDMFAVWQLVNDSLCWYYMTGDELILLPRNETMSEKPKKAFRFMDFAKGAIGPDVSVYPILGISSPTAAIYIPGAIKGMVIQDVDPKTRKADQKIINDASAKPARTTKGGADIKDTKHIVDADKKTGDGAQRMVVPIESKEAAARVKAEFQRMTGNMGIHVEIDSLGVPDLLPGETVAVQGIGKRLSHNYSVMKLSHVWGANGGSTNFEAVSNAVKLLKSVTKALGKQNSHEQKAKSGKTAQAKSGP